MQTQRAAPGSTGTLAGILPRLVREALSHFGNLAYLNEHLLAVALAGGGGSGAPGVRLRRLLVDAIDGLRPVGGDGRRHRAHALMRLRYVDGLPVPEVCARLAVSHSEYYREHARALAALGVLVQAHLDGDPELSSRTPAGRSHPAPGATLPFVGRDAELAHMTAAFAAVATGRGGQLVLVEGPLGVGKSRLAEEVGRFVASTGGAFLSGRYLRDAGSTLGPWIEALTPPLAGMSRPEVARVAGPYRPQLAEPFPLLRGGGRTVASELVGPEDRRHLLHEGLVHMLRALAAERPLALLIEDLQWAPGLGLLRHLAGRLAGMRLLALATVRHQEIDRHPDLARERAELLRLGSVSVLELTPLRAPETQHLVGCRLGDEAARRIGAAVHRRTGGNPLFIEEVVRALAAGGPAGETLPLPPSLRAAVNARVERLGDGAERVLAQAAVLGAAFTFADLLAVSGRQEEALCEVLAAAHTDGLLADTGQAGNEAYAFRDEHVREALYETAAPPLRRRWHLRAARALEARSGAADRAADLAYHFSAGGDTEAGARYSLLAGERLQAACDWEAAALQYRRALAMWERAGGHEAERSQACQRLADVIFFAGSAVGEGIGHLRRALHLARQAGARHAEAMVHVRLGRELAAGPDLRVRDLSQALRHLEAARTLLEGDGRADAADRCHVSLELSAAYCYALDGTAALAAAERAGAMARAGQDPGLTVLAEGMHAALVACAGRPGEGLAAVDRCQAAAHAAGLRWHADLLMTSRCFLEGFLHPARVAALAGRLPPAGTAPARLLLPQQVAGACAHTGDFAAAAALQAMIQRTLGEAGQPAFGPEPQYSGRLLLRSGAWEQAEALMVAARRWATGAGDHSREAFTAQVLGELYLDRGEVQAAAEALHGAVRLQRDGAFRLGLVEALALLARCLCAEGQVADAESALCEARSIVSSPQGWGRLLASLDLAQALVMTARHGPAAGEPAFRMALQGFRAEGLRWDEAHALDQWGRVRRDGELRHQARALWTEMGAHRYAERRAG